MVEGQSGLSSDEHLPCQVSSCWGELFRFVRVGYVPFPQFNRTDNTLLRVCQVKALVSNWLQCCMLTQSGGGARWEHPFQMSLYFIDQRQWIDALCSHPGPVSFTPRPHSFYLVKPSSLTLIRAGAEVGFLSRMAGIPERSLFWVCLL